MISVNTYAADIITLTNAHQLQGKVLNIRNRQVTFSIDESTFLIPSGDIYSIQFENPENKIYQRYLSKLKADESLEKCMNARNDAQQLHGKKGGHFVLGVLFGPFAMLGTALANPNPLNGRNTPLLSSHKNQFNDPEYLACYKKKAKGQLIGMEGLGWLAWVLFIVAF